MSKTIRTSNNLTIDAVGDIILDADNADVKLQDGGTEFGRISRITSDLVIKSMGNNNDIILKGIDDSATINALTLDMSEGGAATFSGNVTATDITANSLTTNVISSNGSNAELSLQASGTGDVLISALRVNGTTLDSADSTKVTIAEAVDITGATDIGGALTGTSASFSTTLGVTGVTTLSGTAVIDNLTINDNIISSSSNADIILTPGGTGNIVAGALTINGTTLSAADSTKITLAEAVDVTGATDIGGALTGTSGVFSGNLTATDVTANSLTTNVISSNGSNAELSLQASGTGDVVVSALRVNGTTLDSADSTKITVAEDVDVTGTLFSRGNVFGVQTLTGSGSTEVVNLTDTVTLLVTTGGSQAFSLANGTEGQLKIISMKTDGGSGIVTPASFVNGSSITFDDVQDTIVLMYQSTGWVVLARQNSTVNA